jgi:hypothetical protein
LLKVQLVKVGLLGETELIPPPELPEVFSVNMQLIKFGLLGPLCMPPPFEPAEFALNLQLTIVGLLL